MPESLMNSGFKDLSVYAAPSTIVFHGVTYESGFAFNCQMSFFGLELEAMVKLEIGRRLQIHAKFPHVELLEGRITVAHSDSQPSIGPELHADIKFSLLSLLSSKASAHALVQVFGIRQMVALEFKGLYVHFNVQGDFLGLWGADVTVKASALSMKDLYLYVHGKFSLPTISKVLVLNLISLNQF